MVHGSVQNGSRFGFIFDVFVVTVLVIIEEGEKSDLWKKTKKENI